MKILCDTNIFIDRENYEVIPENLQRILRVFSDLEYSLLIHPSSYEEINRDRNEKRKKIVLSKIKTYQVLDKAPDPQQDLDFIRIVGAPSTRNAEIDNRILYSVYKNAVNFLITEDKKILSKAYRLNLQDRVLRINEALDVFKEKIPTISIVKPPAIVEDFCYNLSLDDPFFDSIKSDYPEFNEWFQKICQEHRKCWVYKTEEDLIDAILIYKLEDEVIISNPVLPKKTRLKICTFKTQQFGYKIGELFIKLSVELCVKQNIDEMYLTVFSYKYENFVNLIQEYGFEKKGVKENGEDIYVKLLIPENIEEIEDFGIISKKYYPSFYDGKKAHKFLIPIRPEFHERLFTGLGRQTTLAEFAGSFIIEGNTIKKAYLSHSGIKKMRPGDILLFYKSKMDRSISSLGVIEELYRLRDPDKILQYVLKRTVYSIHEIIEISEKSTLVILFTFHFHFDNPVGYDFLLQQGILKGPPQTIIEIDDSSYRTIKHAGGIDERYIVN